MACTPSASHSPPGQVPKSIAPRAGCIEGTLFSGVLSSQSHAIPASWAPRNCVKMLGWHPQSDCFPAEVCIASADKGLLIRRAAPVTSFLTMTPPSLRLQWPCLVPRTTVRAPRSPAHGLTTKACRSPPPGLRASSEFVVTKYLRVPSRSVCAGALAHDHPLDADDLNSITRTNYMT